MYIAIITARGGSKRIPRKNIKQFCGKPMIAWPIEAAKEAGCFDHIIVSTDDAEIAVISKEYGAEVPFMRPAELANDFAHAHKAARHALEAAIKEWGMNEAFCHIYPTAPFLSGQTIREGLACIKKGASNSFAAIQLNVPIYQVMIWNKVGQIERLFPPDKVNMRSQDMPSAFIDAGQMYWFNTRYFLEYETAMSPTSAMVPIPQECGVDIDTEENWAFAEKLAALVRRDRKP